jgi:tetratricopeptide (TPR) repeat protein
LYGRFCTAGDMGNIFSRDRKGVGAPSYNQRMRRIPLLALFLAGALGAQQPAKPPEKQPKDQQQEQQPPEEDESLKPREYSFNPLEAEHDLQIGNYYFKKGSFKAAMNRFREATLWNPSYADAFLRLGDTEEKLKDKKAAQDAYAKYLELAPDGKEAEAVKKKLAGKR